MSLEEGRAIFLAPDSTMEVKNSSAKIEKAGQILRFRMMPQLADSLDSCDQVTKRN